MLEYIFGNKNTEKILFYILQNKECYASKLAKVFKVPLFGLQRALQRLEKAGLLVSLLKGKTRLYSFNPRYTFLKEFKSFLLKAYAHVPANKKELYYEPKIRTRPRRFGKPILLKNEQN